MEQLLTTLYLLFNQTLDYQCLLSLKIERLPKNDTSKTRGLSNQEGGVSGEQLRNVWCLTSSCGHVLIAYAYAISFFF